jgi:hypothetical protein
MGNGSQLQQISNCNANATKACGDALGSIANVFGVAGGVVSIVGVVLEDMGVIKSDLQIIQDAILAAYNQLGAHIKAEDINLRLTNLDNQSAEALKTLDGLPADLNANLDQDARNRRIEDCAGPLEAMANAVWYAPYDDQVYWSDWNDHVVNLAGKDLDAGYGEIVPSADATGNVFSYTFVLPYYLRALTIFLTEAGALDPNFAMYWSEPLTRWLQVLQTYHDKIVNEGIIQLSPIAGLFEFYKHTIWARPGIRSPQSQLPPPTPWTASFLFTTYNPPQPNIDPAPWVGVTPVPLTGGQGFSIAYGAVEKFSGASAMGTYDLKIGAYEEYGWMSFASTDPSPYKKFQLRLLRKPKELCIGIGLLDVWKAINALRLILGMAPLSRPNYADWSFREISNIVGLTSLAKIKTFIESTLPIDTPPDTGIIPLGFRALLEV